MCYVLTKYELTCYVLCYALIVLYYVLKKTTEKLTTPTFMQSRSQKYTTFLCYLFLDKLNETGLKRKL